MSTVTENDLRELKDLISELAQTQKKEFTSLNEKINDMRVDIATLKEGQNSLNIRLNETKDALGKRLDSVENRLNTVTLGVFGIIGVLVTGLLTFVGKVVFFPNI